MKLRIKSLQEAIADVAEKDQGVVSPVYADAIRQSKKNRDIVDKIKADKDKEASVVTPEEPSTGKAVKNDYTEQITLDESLFESLDNSASAGSVSDVAKFIEDSVKSLIDGTAANCRYKLDDRLAVFVGWSEGYGKEDRDDVIQAKENKDFAINAGIKVWTSDDLWSDYDFLNFPYYSDGSVMYMSESVVPGENFTELAKSLLDWYNDCKDLEIASDGLITPDEEITESLKKVVKENVHNNTPYDKVYNALFFDGMTDEKGTRTRPYKETDFWSSRQNDLMGVKANSEKDLAVAKKVLRANKIKGEVVPYGDSVLLRFKTPVAECLKIKARRHLKESYDRNMTYYDVEKLIEEEFNGYYAENGAEDIVSESVDRAMDHLIYNADIMSIIESNLNWGYIEDTGLVEGVDNVFEFGRACIYEACYDYASENEEEWLAQLSSDDLDESVKHKTLKEMNATEQKDATRALYAKIRARLNSDHIDYSKFTDEEKLERSKLSCISMIDSILAYSADLSTTAEQILDAELSRNHSYLKDYVDSLGREEVINLIQGQLDDLDGIEQSTFTDSEGVTYNSLRWKNKKGIAEELRSWDDNDVAEQNSLTSVSNAIKKFLDKKSIDVDSVESDIFDNGNKVVLKNVKGKDIEVIKEMIQDEFGFDSYSKGNDLYIDPTKEYEDSDGTITRKVCKDYTKSKSKKSNKLKEGLSYGELSAIADAWEDYKKEHNYKYDGDSSLAYEFIKDECSQYYKTQEEQDDIFGYISVIEEPDNIEEAYKKRLTESPVYGLNPQFDSRQSFGGKAQVEIDSKGNKTLYSYDTPVCKIAKNKVSLLPKWDSSVTTLRHVKEFLKQNGFTAESKQQMAQDYAQSKIKKSADTDMVSITVYGDTEQLPRAEAIKKCREWISGSEGAERERYVNVLLGLLDGCTDCTDGFGKKKVESVTKKQGKALSEAMIISDLSDYEPWSGAVDTWEKIKDADKVDAFDSLLEEVYPEGLKMVELNDLLWFDSDWVFEMLNMSEEEEEARYDIKCNVTGIEWDTTDGNDLPKELEVVVDFDPAYDTDVKEVIKDKLEKDYNTEVIDFNYEEQDEQ